MHTVTFNRTQNFGTLAPWYVGLRLLPAGLLKSSVHRGEFRKESSFSQEPQLT
jgi:hypothetical protein